VPLEICLSGELVPDATAAAAPTAPPTSEEDLAPRDDDNGFDLPFFCTGRLIAGVN
jgi:hypothetical protein